MSKQDVREFYDKIGWQQVEDGIFQNARYEDLRPVSQDYIEKCHQRVSRHLAPSGEFLLDAGSGPIQYDAYLQYSENYQYRVCADMSITALEEARRKIGDHGLFVVADIANLPFEDEAFDGVVTLHTIHHLPVEEHVRAYEGLNRVLKTGRQAVIVNGWSRSPLMDFFRGVSRLRRNIWLLARRLLGRPIPKKFQKKRDKASDDASGTFVQKHDPAWFKRAVKSRLNVQILVWRSVSVHFLKNYISDGPNGQRLLQWIYQLEERYPRFFGEKGSYPLIVLRKP
jgi:SAM-dependent methyltransferase